MRERNSDAAFAFDNVGRVDRIVRIVLGLAILSLLIFARGDAHWLGLVGLVPLVTALAGWCPAYSLLGLSTCARPPAGRGTPPRR